MIHFRHFSRGEGHDAREGRSKRISFQLNHAHCHGGCKAVLEMINWNFPVSTRRVTLGADKGCHSTDFIAAPMRMVVTPHVAQKARHSASGGRTRPASRLRPVPAELEED